MKRRVGQRGLGKRRCPEYLPAREAWMRLRVMERAAREADREAAEVERAARIAQREAERELKHFLADRKSTLEWERRWRALATVDGPRSLESLACRGMDDYAATFGKW